MRNETGREYPEAVRSGVVVRSAFHAVRISFQKSPTVPGAAATPEAAGLGAKSRFINCQGPQLPAPSQTPPAPHVGLVHAVPAGANEDREHTGAPEVQSIIPIEQPEASKVQAAPALQGRQAPVEVQKSPVPHSVPTGRRPVELQTSTSRHPRRRRTG